MPKSLKKLIAPIIPKPILNAYHYGESIVASQKYSNPSNKMIMIGIVGSKGKTTTANMLWSILSADGTRVGLIGTANIKYGQKEELNKYHMTMPGALVLQKILANMASINCKYVVMEVPSEGQTQYRHIGINFDVLVFTNVTSELMAAHDFSLNTLHKHNKRVFKKLHQSKRKTINSKIIQKLVVANSDSKDSKEYLIFPADKKITFGTKSANYKLGDVSGTKNGISFEVNNVHYKLKMLGKINAINAVGAIATASELGASKDSIVKGLSSLAVIPGRMEVIESNRAFLVIVDYAHEQTSMTALMDGAKDLIPKGGQIITLLGAEGGGRDSAKRPVMGQICTKGSDIIILTNVDPYEDNPMDIINDIKKGALKAGAIEGKTMFIIPDRREGIYKALELAGKNDLVLITGKGSEQSIVIGGKSSPWDDRKVVREEIKKLAARASR